MTQENAEKERSRLKNNREKVKELVDSLSEQSDHLKEIVRDCEKINIWLPDDIYAIRTSATLMQIFATKIKLKCDKIEDQFGGKIVSNTV